MSTECMMIATDRESWTAIAVFVVVMSVMVFVLGNQEEIWAWIKSKFKRKDKDDEAA